MNIEVQQLTVSYKEGNRRYPAIRGLSCELGTGLTGILGHNGSGKTTLLRVLSGLLRPEQGRVSIDGQDYFADLQRYRPLTGYLPQSFGFYSRLTGKEMLGYVALLKGMADRRQRAGSVDEALGRMRLQDVAKRPISQYSRGMKQRLGIALTLLGNPACLLLDEPGEGLDVEERGVLRDLLLELAAQRVVVLSTHALADVAVHCHKILVLQQGRAIFDGTLSQLAGGLSSPANAIKALEDGYRTLIEAGVVK